MAPPLVCVSRRVSPRRPSVGKSGRRRPPSHDKLRPGGGVRVGDSGRSIDTGSEQLVCRVEERVAFLTLNRPEARNALTMELKQALARVLPELARDPEVGAVLLTGAGGDFCAGGDTKGMAREGRPRSEEHTSEL